MPPDAGPARRRVQAAGGIVVRERDGLTEVLLVHRPQYDDWSFPKGKLDPGESHEQAAVREIEEETALRCRLARELPGTSYVDHQGRDKDVRYWVMAIESGDARAQNEVDEVRWLPLDEARGALSYDRDRGVLDAFREVAAR